MIHFSLCAPFTHPSSFLKPRNLVFFWRVRLKQFSGKGFAIIDHEDSCSDFYLRKFKTWDYYSYSWIYLNVARKYPELLCWPFFTFGLLNSVKIIFTCILTTLNLNFIYLTNLFLFFIPIFIRKWCICFSVFLYLC